MDHEAALEHLGDGVVRQAVLLNQMGLSGRQIRIGGM